MTKRFEVYGRKMTDTERSRVFRGKSMSNDNNGIIDLASKVREKQALEEARQAAEAERKASEPDPDRVYEVKIKDQEPFQTTGVLVLTGAFFALGRPVGNEGGFDFNWASPVESVEYVVALDEDDVNDD